jgi:hypothetical protein
MEPSKQPLSKLLTIEGTQESYRVPKYQRPYSWSARDWQQLVEDIHDDANDKEGHYMGSVICVDASSGAPGEPRVYELIDGQQRITTISCLLIAIWSKLNKVLSAEVELKELSSLDEDDVADLKALMDDVRRKVVRERRYQKDEKMPVHSSKNTLLGDFYIGRKNRTDYYCRILPSSQDLNRVDYLNALNHYGLLALVEHEVPRNWGNRRIAKCIRYFSEELPGDVTALKLLAQRVNALIFIHIKVDNHSDAFRLFEAINNRGVPLSALDIIKNAMLATLERSSTGAIDEAFETWSAMTESLGPDSSLHESYLRHFYNAFQVESGRSVPNFKRATKTSLISIFEYLIKKDAGDLLDALARRASFYSAITQPERADIPALRRSKLLNLSRLDAKPSHQFLLYMLDRENQGGCTTTDVNKSIDFLARYFVRRNLTSTPATNRLDGLFIELVSVCEKALKKSGSFSYELVRSTLLKAKGSDTPADDGEFEEALSTHIYYYNPGVARYLLCNYVMERETKERQIDLWRRDDKGRYVWTIEHVLPQGTLKPGWVKMLAGGDTEKALEIQEQFADQIGNLTLSAYNSNLSNAELVEKQKKSVVTLAGDKASIGYKNGLLLNELKFKVGRKLSSLSSAASWDQEYIDARTDVLVAAMMSDYKL